MSGRYAKTDLRQIFASLIFNFQETSRIVF